MKSFVNLNSLLTGIIGFVLSVSASTSAYAFSLQDHTLITTRAVTELNQCFHQTFSEDDLQRLDHADLWEDLNFLNKWTYYSHYFRPFELLKFTFRTDARARVENLAESSFTLESLGGILHYVQDAASPPHVVPVSHDLSDGFESYSLSQTGLLEISRPHEDCHQLTLAHTHRKPVLELLDESGLGTLQLLAQFRVQGLSSVHERVFTSDSFWKEAPFDQEQEKRPFGEYGELGNSFGNPEVILDGITYRVSPSEYDRIKVSQLRLAVEVSKKLLLHGI